MQENIYENPLDFGISGEDQPEQLEITEANASALLKTSNWFTFLGGLLFFLVLVMALSIRAAASSLDGLGVGGGVVLGILIILTIIPAVFYWSAGNKIRLGFMRSETEIVEKGFRHVLWAYRYTGILTILFLIILVASIVRSIYIRMNYYE